MPGCRAKGNLETLASVAALAGRVAAEQNRRYPPIWQRADGRYNGIMVLPGIVQNGVVVLNPGASVPEGTLVSVHVPAPVPTPPVQTPHERMSPEEKQRMLAILHEIANLPDENPGDTFSGADHDKVLYGEP
jgi:hypothetical protein